MDTELLQKFYNGKCSEEEAQWVRNWFLSEEDKEAFMVQLKAYWAEFEVSEENEIKGYNPAAVLENTHARIQKEENEIFSERPVIPINRNKYFGLRVASIVALAICGSFLWHFLQTSIFYGQTERSSVVIKAVPYGERRTVILEEGTEVILNAGSKLSYLKHFSADKRQVKLEGEAFFKVARDVNRPFTVITGDILTTVLGTSFNIKAEAGAEEIEVAVATGKVRVSHYEEEESRLLLPGKAVTYKEGESMSVFDFDREEVLSWKNGVLYFREASYEEVKERLERWYGVKIESVGRSYQDWQYSASFEGQSLNDVLNSIGFVKDFSYSIKGNRVKIKFKGS